MGHDAASSALSDVRFLTVAEVAEIVEARPGWNADRVVGLADSQIVFDAAPSELTDAQLERIYAGRSTTQPANAPAEPPVMLEPSLEMSR